MIDLEERATVVGAICLVVALVIGGVFLARQEMACQRHGYPEAKVWPTVTYCVKRVNQTDIVVRLDSLDGAK